MLYIIAPVTAPIKRAGENTPPNKPKPMQIEVKTILKIRIIIKIEMLRSAIATSLWGIILAPAVALKSWSTLANHI